MKKKYTDLKNINLKRALKDLEKNNLILLQNPIQNIIKTIYPESKQIKKNKSSTITLEVDEDLFWVFDSEKEKILKEKEVTIEKK